VRLPLIEYVTVADHAEAINGKLYLQGAGWTDITALTGPNGETRYVHLGLAVSVLVGWNETNQRFPLRLTISDEDGAELIRVNAQIEAGRPAGAQHGSDFRKVLAFGAEVQFPRPGGYQLRAVLGEDQERAVSFRVHTRPQAAPPPGPPPPGPPPPGPPPQGPPPPAAPD
jgi:hypothetical protein